MPRRILEWVIPAGPGFTEAIGIAVATDSESLRRFADPVGLYDWHSDGHDCWKTNTIEENSYWQIRGIPDLDDKR